MLDRFVLAPTKCLSYLLRSCQPLVPNAPRSRCPWFQTIEVASSSKVCLPALSNVNLAQICLQSSYWSVSGSLGEVSLCFLFGQNNTFRVQFCSILFICISYCSVSQREKCNQLYLRNIFFSKCMSTGCYSLFFVPALKSPGWSPPCVSRPLLSFSSSVSRSRRERAP